MAARSQGKATLMPEPRRQELSMQTQIGALNSLRENIHRRDVLWQVEHAGDLRGRCSKTCLGRRNDGSPCLSSR